MQVTMEKIDFVRISKLNSLTLILIEKTLNGPPIITFFNYARLSTYFVVGIVFDVLMMKFLRKRENQIAPQSPGRDRLVPWKSGPQEKEGLTIPLRATIVNTIGIFFSKFFFPKLEIP